MNRALLIVGMVVGFVAAASVQAGGDAQLGKAKAEPCAGCHGQNGEGTTSAPALAGTPEGKFIEAIGEYKSGKRSNAAMKAFARRLSDQDVSNLAAFYAGLKGR